ncbi:MAG: HDOD domain-containing protein [Desulfobacterales bacterium]|nr:HDOD domain-containing protein [Desulfobacterales bacterium]
MASNTNINNLIKKIDQIPTLPIVSKQIMDLLKDPDASLNKIVDLIEKDVSLTVKILKVANSAFYGTLSKVSSIDHALVVIGLGEVRSILYAFSIYNFFPKTTEDTIDRSQFWKHSIVCSQVARYLSQYFEIPQNDSLFISGLIHDMGKIVFDQYFHDEFMEIHQYVEKHNTTFSKAEKEVIGITHYQVAAKLLQKWNFPKEVILQVFYHHAPWQNSGNGTGSTIVYLANMLSKMAGFYCSSQEQRIEISDFAHSNFMDYVVKNGFDLDANRLEQLVVHIREFIAKESENMMTFFES